EEVQPRGAEGLLVREEDADLVRGEDLECFRSMRGGAIRQPALERRFEDDQIGDVVVDVEHEGVQLLAPMKLDRVLFPRLPAEGRSPPVRSWPSRFDGQNIPLVGGALPSREEVNASELGIGRHLGVIGCKTVRKGPRLDHQGRRLPSTCRKEPESSGPARSISASTPRADSGASIKPCPPVSSVFTKPGWIRSTTMPRSRRSWARETPAAFTAALLIR